MIHISVNEDGELCARVVHDDEQLLSWYSEQVDSGNMDLETYNEIERNIREGQKFASN